MIVMNTIQAAEFLMIHSITLTKKAKAGIIPAVKIGREWRFYKDHLIEYLRGQTTTLENKQEHQSNNVPHNLAITPAKKEYLKLLGLTDCPQIHSPSPDPLRGARHARAANRVAKGKAVELVGKSVSVSESKARMM